MPRGKHRLFRIDHRKGIQAGRADRIAYAGDAREVGPKAVQQFDRAERHQCLDAAGCRVQQRTIQEISRPQPEHVEHGADIFDLLAPSVWLADARLSAAHTRLNRSGQCCDRHGTPRQKAQSVEQPDCAERRMAAHLHLVVRHEEAKLVVAAVSAGKYERALMAVLCSDSAHRLAIQRAGIDDDGRRVATIGSIAEHIDQKHGFGVPAIGSRF